LEHLALDWLDADAAPGEARSLGRQQRLLEQTADGELVGRLLAELGVDPDAAVEMVATTDGDEVTTKFTPLTRAAVLGHVKATRLLLDAGAEPSRANGNGTTPLMEAAAEGHLEVVRLLLEKGAAVDVVDPVDKFTAFHCACYHNQAECGEALARAGCDVGIEDVDGETGWQLADRMGHAAVVAGLRAVVGELGVAQAGAAPLEPEPEPEPARVGGERLAPKLAKAATEGDGVAVTRLLAAGADPNASARAGTPDGEVFQTTPLCMAAQNGRLEAARLLLDGGADPSRADGNGATALMQAAWLGQLEVLQLLLDRGAAVDTAQPTSCRTAFHAACGNNQAACAEALARAGCDVGIKNIHGETGQEVAETKGHAGVVERVRGLEPAGRPGRGGGGGGVGGSSGARKKRKKRKKKKRTAQPGVEPEPELGPEPEPELQPELQPAPDAAERRNDVAEVLSELTAVGAHRAEHGADAVAEVLEAVGITGPAAVSITEEMASRLPKVPGFGNLDDEESLEPEPDPLPELEPHEPELEPELESELEPELELEPPSGSMAAFDEAAVLAWLGTVPGLTPAQRSAAAEEMAEDEYDGQLLIGANTKTLRRLLKGTEAEEAVPTLLAARDAYLAAAAPEPAAAEPAAVSTCQICFEAYGSADRCTN
jgi:ankyrin repeat protein